MNDAEKSVLGAALIDPVCVPIVCGELTKDYFSSDQPAVIFEAIRELHAAGTSVDLVTLECQLQKVGTYDRAGGIECLCDLMSFVPTSANVRNYIEQLQSTRKAVVFRSGMARALSLLDNGDDFYADEAKATLDAINSIGAKSEQTLADILPEVLNRLGDKTLGIRTGFRALDAVAKGFYPGRLIIIGARPGIGKTALACNIAANMCKDGRTVAYFSLEMSRAEIAERMVLSEALVDQYKAYRGGEETTEKILEAQESMSAWKLLIDDRASVSAGQIVSTCYKFIQQYGHLDCVFVDYLQLMRVRQRRESNRAEELGTITRAMKIFSREINCPIVMLAQLSRVADGTRPTIAHLRESGAIEQDADMVILLHRTEEAPTETTLIIGKNRHGAVGDDHLVWRADCTRFMDEEFKDAYVPKGVFDE